MNLPAPPGRPGWPARPARVLASAARALAFAVALAFAFALAFSLALAPPVAWAKPSSTADHTKFKELQGPFASGEEVTKVCNACHTEAPHQVMATRHWTWEYTNPDTGQKLGKKTMLNSFCIGDQSNEVFCQACHVGYGWKDKSFDFKAASKVDCLVCHHDGKTGYRKPPGLAGEVPTVRTEYPPGSGKFIEPVNLAKVAQAVGKTSTNTCGSCHYNGGGGDGVKHGDLDSSLNRATPALDVHMAPKSAGGAGFSCATCHQADGHRIAGSRISMTAADPHGPVLRGHTGDDGMDGRNAATCQSCHGDKPHRQGVLAVELLNNHTDKLACQSCHIPSFARGGVATKMAWDWSTAGRLTPEGKPFQKKDAKGHVVYDSKKGEFTFGENVVPDYLWFNGQVSYTLQGDRIDPKETVHINRFLGSADDPAARIWPVKRFAGNQPYDLVHQRLLVPHTATPDDTSFWFNFDWTKALQTGAQATGLPFSGQHGFVRTEMLWPITHMVAPAHDAVRCSECHTGTRTPLKVLSAGLALATGQEAASAATPAGRLAGVPGVYLPGRDAHPWIDRLGWLAAVAALLGVLAHALGRIFSRRGGRHD